MQRVIVTPLNNTPKMKLVITLLFCSLILWGRGDFFQFAQFGHVELEVIKASIYAPKNYNRGSHVGIEIQV